MFLALLILLVYIHLSIKNWSHSCICILSIEFIAVIILKHCVLLSVKGRGYLLHLAHKTTIVNCNKRTALRERTCHPLIRSFQALFYVVFICLKGFSSCSSSYSLLPSLFVQVSSFKSLLPDTFLPILFFAISSSQSLLRCVFWFCFSNTGLCMQAFINKATFSGHRMPWLMHSAEMPMRYKFSSWILKRYEVNLSSWI